MSKFEREMTPESLKKDANSSHLVVRFWLSTGTLFFNRMAMRLLEGGIFIRPKAKRLLKLMEEIKDANSY